MYPIDTLKEILDEKIYSQYLHALEVTEREMQVAENTIADSSSESANSEDKE